MGGYNPRYPQQWTWTTLLGEVQPIRSRTIVPSSGRLAPQGSQKDILAMKEDLFGYARYHIPCKYLLYNRIDLGLNRLITLPPRLYKVGRYPLEFISYTIQYTKDIGCRVLHRSDDLNQSKPLSLRSCHHPVPITHTSTNLSTTVGKVIFT